MLGWIQAAMQQNTIIIFMQQFFRFEEILKNLWGFKDSLKSISWESHEPRKPVQVKMSAYLRYESNIFLYFLCNDFFDLKIE